MTLESSGPGLWDTDGASASGYWALGVAGTLDGALLTAMFSDGTTASAATRVP